LKHRLSFVTNSSSSSFICDICGESHSGWDLSPYDIGGGRCINGHKFCNCFDNFDVDKSKLKEELTIQIKNQIEATQEYTHCTEETRKKWINEYQNDLAELSKGDTDIDDLVKSYFDDGLPMCMCPICSMQTFSDVDMANYLYKLYHVDRGLVFAEIKKNNKRRRKLYDSEYIDYVCNQQKITTDELMTNIKRDFKTYDEFLESL